MLKRYATTLWDVDHILQIITVVAFKLVLNRKEKYHMENLSLLHVD